MPTEKNHKIWHSSMVNVRVRPGESPILGIHFKICFHILMHFLLQINSKLSIGSYYNVGTNTFVGRHISVWVIYCKITGVINYFLFGQHKCGVGKFFIKSSLSNCNIICTGE